MIDKKLLNLQVGYSKEKNQKRSSRKEVYDFFARLVVVIVVDLAGLLRYFVRAIVDLTIGLANGGAVLTEKEVAVGFSKLFLW